MASAAVLCRSSPIRSSSSLRPALSLGSVHGIRQSAEARERLRTPVMKHNFRGKNFLIVGIGLLAFQTSDPRWCSFLQAKEKGWTVKKGSKATNDSLREEFDREGCRRRPATSRRTRPSGCLPNLFRMSALRTGAAMRTNRGQAGPTSYHMNRPPRRHVFESGRHRWGSVENADGQ